jgi:anti-sigma factor RsiW
MTTMGDSQRWAEERLVSYLLDALPEADAERVEEILAEIPQYQDILSGRRPEDIGHIPASLLARWNTAGLNLVGVERVLVLQHLESCPRCREELELVGGSLRSWAEAPESAPREPMEPRPRSDGRHARVEVSSPWRAAFGGALIGVAAGIVLMLLLPRHPESTTPGLHGVPLPVVVPQTLRGSEQSTVELASKESPLLLALGLPRVANEVDAQLVVLDPKGNMISQSPIVLGPSAQRTAQLVLQPPEGWLEGEYTIELRMIQELHPRDLGSFTVRLRP